MIVRQVFRSVAAALPKAATFGLLTGVGFFAVLPANAATFCGTYVTGVVIHSNGTVWTQYTGETVTGSSWKPSCVLTGDYVVNDGAGQRTITLEMCQAVYSQALSAMQAGNKVTLAFNATDDCATRFGSQWSAWAEYPYSSYIWS